jgi:hypothetical protein
VRFRELLDLADSPIDGLQVIRTAYE